MRKLTMLAVMLPMMAAAAPPAAGAAAPGAERGAHADRMQRRMRLARTMGLAEALDLDDAAALRVRDVLARYDEKRAPLREQARGALRIVRDAARGDQAAAGQVDAALQRARDARSKLQQLEAQQLDEITKGFAPERKARAAVFLAAFHHRAQRFGFRGHCMEHGMRGHMGEHGMGGHMGGAGMGGPGPHGPHAEEGALEPGHGPDAQQAMADDIPDDELAGAF